MTIVHCTNSHCKYNDNGCGTYYGICSNESVRNMHMFVERVYKENCRFQEKREDCGTIAVLSSGGQRQED